MTNFLLATAPIADSLSRGWEGGVRAAANAASQNNKFWLVEDLWRMLRDLGMGERWTNLAAFVAACAILLALVWILNVLVVKLSMAAISRHSARSKNNLDDILLKRKFFSRMFQLLLLTIVLKVDNIIFAGFSVNMIIAFDLLLNATIVIVVLLIIYSMLDTWNDVFLKRPAAQTRSIKGYLQVAKIVLAFAAAILVISILLRKDPSNLFVGLGATAALFSLVFKDTILGFVASIQLSAQDMVRPGDWIEMPSKNADGTVLEMNVNSVKVQNWDNTVTMIPIYAMVSESFTNWRGMEQSEGRRFVRYIYINIESVKFIGDEFLERLMSAPATASLYDQAVVLARHSSPDNLTNLAMFRANIEIFLRSHPKINDELPLYVRYKQEISDKGIGIEIYAFSRDKQAVDYDAVHRSVVEYVVAAAPLFDIQLFQSPSGLDFHTRTTPTPTPTPTPTLTPIPTPTPTTKID